MKVGRLLVNAGIAPGREPNSRCWTMVRPAGTVRVNCREIACLDAHSGRRGMWVPTHREEMMGGVRPKGMLFSKPQRCR